MKLDLISLTISIQIITINSFNIYYKPITNSNFLLEASSVKFSKYGIEKNLKCINICVKMDFKKYQSNRDEDLTKNNNQNLQNKNNKPNAQVNFYGKEVHRQLRSSNGNFCKNMAACKELNEKKLATKFLENNFKFIGICEKTSFYISNELIPPSDMYSYCCKANLHLAHLSNFNQMNCIRGYYREKYGYVKSLQASLDHWDSYFNKLYLGCHKKSPPDEIWANDHKNESCIYGKCKEYATYLELCADCDQFGLNTFFLNYSTRILCYSNDLKFKEINKNLIYSKTSQMTTSLDGDSCKKMLKCTEPKKVAFKFLNDNFNLIGTCGNKKYYITKNEVQSLGLSGFCCKANLLRATLTNLNEMNCINAKYIEKYGNEKAIKVLLSHRDTYFNKTYLNCNNKSVPQEIWAKEEPETCIYGNCKEYSTYLELCSDCNEFGLHSFYPNGPLNILCVTNSTQDIIINNNTRGKNMYVKNVQVIVELDTERCNKMMHCPAGSKDILIKFRNENFNFIGKCGNNNYYITKTPVKIFELFSYCCKANLLKSVFSNINEINCLRSKYKETFGSVESLKPSVGHWDKYLNNSYLGCYNQSLSKELWANGQPEECVVGKCREYLVYLELCSDCNEFGLHSYYPDEPKHLLCLSSTDDNNKVKPSKAKIYSQEVHTLLKLGDVSCKKVMNCKTSKQTAKRFLDENFKYIGICNNKIYYISKTALHPIQDPLYCCNANLNIGYFSNFDEINCIRSNYKAKYGYVKHLPAGIVHWDSYLNNTYMGCTNNTVPQEIWAKGEPEECINGKCRKYSAYLELCSDCDEFGLHTFFPDRSSYKLCFIPDRN